MEYSYKITEIQNEDFLVHINPSVYGKTLIHLVHMNPSI